MTDVVSDTKARIAKLDLEEGDTLVVTVPERLSPEKRIMYVRFMQQSLPVGVKCMILDGGVTLEKLKREHESEVDSTAYRAAFYPEERKPMKLSWWQRLCRWLDGG